MEERAGQTAGQVRVGPLEVLAFLSELAMLAALAVAGWLGADAVPARLALAVAMPGLAVAIWGVWMAPRSPRRLRNPWRLVVQVALFALAGGALAAVSLPWWGLAVAATGIADVVALALRERAPKPAR